jgi:hypothetical protein
MKQKLINFALNKEGRQSLNQINYLRNIKILKHLILWFSLPLKIFLTLRRASDTNYLKIYINTF